MDDEEAVLNELQECVESQPDDPTLHFKLGVLLWEKGEASKAAEHLVISAKLNPNNGATFRYLGHYYSRFLSDSARAFKCYERAVTLNPEDSDAGDVICDFLDSKESLEVSICRSATSKSPRAFWAFRRLGYLQLHHKQWSEAVQSLQHAIRGYPTSADLWEALGLAYQQMGMFTAAIKSYGRAIELEDARVFALVESGNVFLMLGSFTKGVEQFQQALKVSPQNVSAQYGLASALLSLAKECVDSGAYKWGACLLEEASEVAITCASLAGNISCTWKLHGDIQLKYAKCFPWMEDSQEIVVDEKAFSSSIHSWKSTCYQAAVSASHSYQRALHLAPWQANMYADIAIAEDLIFSLKETQSNHLNAWSLSEKMCLGSLYLEGENDEFWVGLGFLSNSASLKQHAFIRGLQLDVSQAVAWAYLGKLYRQEGKKKLAQQAFDRARSIDPSLALPWAGMTADANGRKLKPEEAYECCLRAVQIFPIAEFQIGLAKLALSSGHLLSPEVFGAIRQALQRAPQYPESHNLNGLISEARGDYLDAVASYRLARYALSSFAGEASKFCLQDISINLARALYRGGNANDAVGICEDLKKEGLLDTKGLQIYALSLWQLGKNDLALSVARTLAGSVLSMERPLAASSITFICRLLYYISGQGSATLSILKMPKELFQSSKISFVVSAIHALDQSNQLESVVSISRSSLTSSEDITAMHVLIALGKLVKFGSKSCLAIQKGIDHLRKALHMYPNSPLIRNLLGYLLLSSKEWKDIHIAARCFTTEHSHRPMVDHLKSAYEIVGAGAVACYTTGYYNEKLSFPTCRDQMLPGSKAIRELQKCLHHEPWNHNARYLLVLCYFQKACEERYAPHLCSAIERLIGVTLSNLFYLEKDLYHQYKRFQLLLCTAEVSLQSGNHSSCIEHAGSASLLSLPDSSLFFAHLLLCRAYAVENNFISLNEEYKRCMELKTDCHIGWICLKYIESRYELQSGTVGLSLSFEECSKDIKNSWNMWLAVYSLVQGLIAIWTEDFLVAEEFLMQACSFATSESCFYICHGAICMELAKRQCDSQFLSLAVKSLKKAKETSLIPLPIVSLLLAQAEGSLGSKAKWEKNLHDEWLSWPPEMRPAELLLQMNLLSVRQENGSNISSTVELDQNPIGWVLRAIHLNPSCLRYWKVLWKLYGTNQDGEKH